MREYLLRLCLAATCILSALCASGQITGTASPGSVLSNGAAPSLTKEQANALEKNSRLVYKQCKGDTGKHRDQTAEACIQLSLILNWQFNDTAGARVALQRSCFLGSERGCDHLGTNFADAGDIASARAAWNAPPCLHSSGCKKLLFKSYANMSPPSLTAAEEIGLPLCEQDGGQEICDRLKQIGSQADFGAITQRREAARKARIEMLTREVQEAEQEAADSKAAYEKYNADAQANSNAVGLVASISALGFANDYRNKTNRAARLRSELSAMNAQQPAATTAPSASMTSLLDSQQAMLSAQAKGPLGGGAVFPSQTPATTTDVASAASTASPGSVMYTGANAEWVQQLLSKAGPYSCAPAKAPARPRSFACEVRDGSVYQAIALAWATECEAQTGNTTEAAKYAQVMLDKLKQASAGCEGMRTSCTSDNIISCSQLPKR